MKATISKQKNYFKPNKYKPFTLQSDFHSHSVNHFNVKKKFSNMQNFNGELCLGVLGTLIINLKAS